MPEDDREDIQNRLAARFEDDDSDDTEETAETSTPAGSAGSSESAVTEGNERAPKNAKNAMRAKNLKSEWNATSVYLPDFLDRELRTRYKHLDLAFEEAYGESLQKTRYYYPLLVRLGLERLEGMEAQELKERIEQLEQEAGQE